MNLGDGNCLDPVPEKLLLPFLPVEMRELIGRTDEAYFDNPEGTPVFGETIELSLYDNVLDFGCGCGRIARRLMQQKPRPKRYLGIDLHKGMITWNQQNLQPLAEGFEFKHHDVFYPSFNPDPTAPYVKPFPVASGSASLLIAYSVFTHLTQEQCEYYLREAARVLRRDGVMVSTWFLFDKSGFPMMQDFQHALYINDKDPGNAAIFNAEWVPNVARELGLIMCVAVPPVIRGFAWQLHFTPARLGVHGVELAADDAPVGRQPPPLVTENASSIGVGTGGS